MGVKDLWQLLSPIGRRVSIETLEGKTLAIDASIWITQFIKAMRDEEGKMMKNAHLIGTLRRVLKLLFHRIRPLFVFDGATPLLKLRTVQARRKGHEKQEENKKIAAQRLLRAQLKQHVLNSAKSLSTAANEATSSNYVSTFKRHIKPSEVGSESSGAVSQKQITEVSDDVEWVYGYEGLHEKNLDADSAHARGEEEQEMEWQLPEDCNDLSPEALAALPAHIRKSLIEEARRRQRMESRAHYLPVAGNPALYSQTQLSNFLNSSKLNRKFADAHQSTQNVLVGTSIAAEGRKKYQFLSRLSLEAADSGKAAQISSSSSAAPPPSSTLSPEWQAIHTDFEDESEEYWEPAGLTDASITAIADSPVHSTPSSPTKAETTNEDDRHLALAIAASLADEQATKCVEVIHLDSEASESLSENGEEEVEEEEVAWESSGDSDGSSAEEEATEVHSQDDFDGEDWKDVDRGNVVRVSDVERNCNFLSQDVKNSSATVEPPRRVTFDSAALSTSSAIGTGALVLESSENFLSNDVLSRAVSTASSMADWAGRAVRSALKEHARNTQLSTASNLDQSKNMTAPSIEKMTPSVDSGPEEVQSTNALSPTTPADEDFVDTATTSVPNGSEFAIMTVEEAVAETRDARRRFNAAMRDTETLTDEMRAEVIELLQALNLPYLIAPYEAEAQCAVLEQMGLVDGVVTEDSDALLFGANTVYKNIFNDKKYVEVYLAEDARREMGLQREDLVALAYFLGSDYCEGVTGVGIVNAVEIIHAFPMRRDEEVGEGALVGAGPLRGLRRFKEWLHGFDLEQELRQSIKSSEEEGLDEKLIAFTEKHKSGRARWTVPASFPDPLVARAYLSPQADNNPEQFAWTVPEARSVRSFCSERLGWTEAQMDIAIDPVLRRYGERSSQTRIDAHFLTYHGDTRFAMIASDRLREAVVQITGKRTNLALGGSAPSSKGSKRSKTKAKTS